MEDMSWVEKQIYTCSTCGEDFELGEMKGNHQKLECIKCYYKPKEQKQK